jgi:hypothetical protein
VLGGHGPHLGCDAPGDGKAAGLSRPTLPHGLRVRSFFHRQARGSAHEDLASRFCTSGSQDIPTCHGRLCSAHAGGFHGTLGVGPYGTLSPKWWLRISGTPLEKRSINDGAIAASVHLNNSRLHVTNNTWKIPRQHVFSRNVC